MKPFRLHRNCSSAVLLKSQLGEFFKATVGVRQGCLLSPILFNLFLEKIMQETLYDYDLPTTSVLWATAVVNVKTSPTHLWTEQRHMEWKSAQKRARSLSMARTTSVQISQ